MRSVGLIVLLVAPASAGAAYVSPQLGGGSPGTTTSMKHADVTLQSGVLAVHIDASVPTPRLRPLLEGDEFDPAAPFATLNGKGYNAQYGWNAGGFIVLPAGSGIWIEQLDASPGLEVYQAPVDANGYAPIFGTGGSSTRWRWSGRMSHNYYAIEDPTGQPQWATYRVYLGDTASGEPLAGYEPVEVTFEFAIPGDYDADDDVDPDDYALWAQQYGAAGPALAADGNGDGVVNAADYTVWRDHVASAGVSVPEPRALASLAVLLVQTAASRRRKSSECVTRNSGDSRRRLAP